MSKTYELLKERGYIYQCTNEEEIKNLLDGDPICAYVGIDPTADSLHIGHCLPLIVARYLQEGGHKVIILLGGATAMVGDPSGKSEMRKMVSANFVEDNRSGLEKAISKFLRLDGDNPAIVVNNTDWFKDYSYIDFMRDIGVHFNVNTMLGAECYKKRLDEGGLTFFEMGYMPMQAYDFVHLNKEYGCRVQFGGSDQWANILAGADLGRKLSIIDGKDPETFQAFTNVLLLNSNGEKMGKTVNGAVWVDKNKCSVYDFYQYFYNVDDSDVANLLRLLTRVPLDEIESIVSKDIIKAKKLMAFEVTKLVHGEEEAMKAQETSEKVFFDRLSSDDMPSVDIDKDVISNGINILDLLLKVNFLSSKSEGRRLIEQGGISVNREKITDFTAVIDNNSIKDGSIILQKGKKVFLKVNI